MRQYIRTCQECGHKAEYKDPSTYVDKTGTEPWRDVKCKKCKSMALNYGSWRSDETTDKGE